MHDVNIFVSILKEKIKSLQFISNNIYFHIEISIDNNFNLLKILSLCNIIEKFYFKDKNDEYEIAGFGRAWNIESEKIDDVQYALNKLWDNDEKIIVFGGVGFFENHVQLNEWENFNRFKFIVPLILIEKKKNKSKLSLTYLNYCNKNIEEVKKELLDFLKFFELKTNFYAPSINQSIINRQMIPDREQWNSIIQTALNHIKKEIKKIVLLRKEIITASNYWNPYNIIQNLKDITDDSFLFLYQINKDKFFLGRSPERLFSLNNEYIKSEAVAGTRSRGKDENDDEILKNELLNSIKEIEEHRIVSKYIKSKMDEFCIDIKSEIVEGVLKLKNIQHIITLFSGKLKKPKKPLDILLSFHPTPAVGGYPTPKALELIKSLEPFQRGWYASPIGWMTKNNADFAVSIRAALINKNELHLFAGTGIVEGSDSNAEWEETENKMRNFYDIFKY